MLQDAETGQGDALHDHRLLHLHAQQEQPHHCNSTTQYVWMKTQTVCVYENTDYMFVWKYKPYVCLKTRGPKGPWVAHLRKRSKVTVKALGLVVSDKKIFESCILKTYFLTP